MYPSLSHKNHTRHAGFASAPLSLERKTGRIQDAITCDWQELRAQLLMQWDRLTESELNQARLDRHRIAELVEGKYGISSCLIENYLRNFERTMPLAAMQ